MDIVIKLCEVYGLSEVAKRQVIDLAFTLDGSNLTRKLFFVMTGLKLVDIAV